MVEPKGSARCVGLGFLSPALAVALGAWGEAALQGTVGKAARTEQSTHHVCS